MNYLPTRTTQNKLEAQYAAKREAHLSEVADLKQQLEMRHADIRNLQSTVDGLKGVNEELKVVIIISQASQDADEILLLKFSAPSRLHRRALKGARTWRRVLPILSALGRLSTCSWPNLTA